MNDAIMKFLSVLEKLIDAAPHAFEHIKALKDQAHEALKDEPDPEVHKAVTNVVEKAAAANPEEKPPEANEPAGTHKDT